MLAGFYLGEENMQKVKHGCGKDHEPPKVEYTFLAQPWYKKYIYKIYFKLKTVISDKNLEKKF